MMTPDEILRQADEQIAARKKQESAPQTAPQASGVKQEPRYLSEADMGFDASARGLKGWGQDIAATAVKGAIAVPEALVGLADIPTGGRVGKFLENKDGAFGFRPKEAKEIVSEWHSDATKQAQQKFQQADGLVDKFGVALENPSLIATTVGESLPLMFTGSLIGRGIQGARGLMAAREASKAGLGSAAATKAAEQAMAKGTRLASAAGEGAVMAGTQASAIRQETEDGLLTPGQAGLSLATGVVGGAFGFGGSKLANRFGVGDVDTMMVQGRQGLAKELADTAAMAATNPTQAVAKAKSLPRKVIEGAIIEGVFEELPQSVMETILQNLALNKPWAEGLNDAIVLGTLAGNTMGAGAAGLRGFRERGAAGGGAAGQQPGANAPVPGAGNWTTSPGAAPLNEAQPGTGVDSLANHPLYQAADFDTSPGAAPVNENALPFEREFDTGNLTASPVDGHLEAPAPAAREFGTGSNLTLLPSEQMGLRTGPDAGPLENAAALSVDTGATAQMQGAAGIVANDLQSEPQAANAIPVVNFDEVTDPYERAVLQRLYDDHYADGELESVISANAELDTSFDFGANVNQLLANAGATPQEIEDAQRGQASAQAADRPGQAQENDRGDFDAELSIAKNEGDGSGRLAGAEQGEASQQPLDQQAAAPGSQAEGANVATLAQLNRKKLAEMSDDELQQLSSLLPADHSRQQKIQKAIQNRAAQAQAAINEGVKADGTQTDQAQQAVAQPSQAGAAQAGQQTTPVAASTNAAPNAVEGHAQTAPEFTTIKTIYGDSVTVRTSDLNSDKTRLRQYTRDGKSKAVPAIHRDNLDATGEKGAAAASNPLFNTIMDRSGAPFGSRAAAQREVDWLGLSGTHDVVPAGNGFVGQAKTETVQAQQQTAQKEQSATETVAPTAGQQTNSQRNASESAAGQAQAATNNLPANLQEGIAASQEKSKQGQPTAQAQQEEDKAPQDEDVRQEADTDASEASWRELIAEREAKIGARKASFDAEIANLKSQHFRGTGVFKGLRSKKAKDEAFNDVVRQFRLSKEDDTKAILDEYRAKIDAHPYESVRMAESARKTREMKAQMAADAARKAAQPITRADVEAAQQQAATIIGARIDAMSAGDVNKIAKKFLPTMGMKPTMSKANNKAAMTDPKINLEAAAAEVGATLPAEVTRALQADMEGRVADVTQDDGITKPAAQSQQAQAATEPVAQTESKAPTEPNPLEHTPKQYADAWLRWSAETNGLPLAEVREMQGDEAGLKAIEQRWVDAVVQEAKSGQPLPTKTLDKLLEVRPNAQLPESAIPDGYQRPEARKAEKEEAAARKARAENPFADYNALAQQYGYEVRQDGAIGSDGKFPGPTMKVKGGRLRIESGSGDLLASYAGTSPDSLGKFLESFWYAEKKADGFVEPAAAKTAAQSPIERAKAVGIKGLRAGMSDETLRQRVKSYLAGERAARLIAAGKQTNLPQYQGVSEKDARTLGALVESYPYSVNTSGERWVLDARGVTTADALVQGGVLKPDNGNYKHELTPVGKEIAREVLRNPIGDASIGDMLTELEESKPKTGNEATFSRSQSAKQDRGTGTIDQTETEAFKRWFGDSKVVDAQGKPLVVYHGTEADFSEFSREYIGSANTQTPIGSGFFFAKDPAVASRYAKRSSANVMPAYVSVQNPAPTLEAMTATGSEYDGFINSKIVVARSPIQVKSATGNNGNFDPANPDIRYSRMDDNAATEGVSNEQRQTPNGIPAGLPATSDPDSQYLERRINNWLQTSGWRADRLSAVSLPIELRTALDRFTDATGTRVVLFRNLTPEIEDFNGVNFRDGRVFINEASQHPATLTAAHEWVHNFKRTNPKLYQQLEDEVREQGRIPQWHQRNIKEEGMDRGIDHAIEELTAAAVSDAMTDPAFLEQLALRNQGVFRRVAQAFLDFLDTLTSGWRDQGSNAYLRDVQAFRNKLADVLDRLPTIGQNTANFAANPARRPGSAQDKAVMQAIADGKSARDVLRLIANGSKDPFLRQLARLLLKSGITPNIQFGYIGKTEKGDPIHGQYRGKSDTIAIAGSAEYAAERIFMHEAMHAATMRALAKPGLVRLQMQKLLEHVRKNGGAAGFYGLKNVDEFVVEVFTNPDFQAALRKMKAPSESSGIKTAWDGFIRILRSILGLKNDPNNVLSQALELGVAAMREDMGLRKRADRASLRLRGDVVAAAGVTPLQLRVQTVEWAKQRWSEGGGGQAEVVRNTDPRFGKDVRIAWQGVKHAIAGANQPELRLIPHVAKIMQSAQYLRSEDDRANRAHIKKAHFFEANVVLDGERLLVGMVVHEKADGQMFYDQFIVSKARDQKDAPPHGTSGNGMPGISDRSVLQPSSGGGSIVGQGMDSGQDGVANFGVDDFARNVGEGIKSITATNIKKVGSHKLTDWLKLGLQFLGRRQLTDVYGDLIPQMRDYDRLAAQMEADKNESGAEADELVRRWAKLPDEGKLADLMHEATLAQVDADSDVEYVAGDDKAQSAILKNRFKALSPEAQAVYREARDGYKAHHEKVRKAIRERIERSELSSPKRHELLAKMDDDFFQKVKGVYFPLARFGRYVTAVKDGTGQVVSVSRAETMPEAESARVALLKAFPAEKGFSVGRVTLDKEFVASHKMVGRGFMTDLYRSLEGVDLPTDQLAELEDTLGQLYLSSLPDLSWAKHGIHRKGTPGFSQDARRAFAQNMFHGARYLAKLRYSDVMQDSLDAMQEHVDEWGAVTEEFDQPKAQRVVDEMLKRHDAMMNPKSNPLSTALTSFGFLYYLGLSPAAAMVNLSQTAMVAYPVLAGKWGYKKSADALLRASKESVAGKNNIRTQLTDKDEIAAYEQAVKAGVIDVTMALDLAGISQGEDQKVSWALRPVMRRASYMFHQAELFNRQSTFIAAFRLAREAGSVPADAYEQAVKATYDGHFDYGAANRPRVMQGNVARVVLLFKQYAQNMIFTLARQAYQSVAGKSPEERRQARKVFAGLLTTHAMAAGVLGLPLVGPLLAAASMLGSDDDEPWDAEVALRNMLAEAVGQKPAEVLAKGVSRLTPWDVSGRVGLHNLIFPDLREGLEGQRWAETFATGMLGPVMGIGTNAAKAAQKMGDGDYGRALEDLLPIAARNPIKAARYWFEGAQDRSGVTIKDEVSSAGALGQLVGFSPSEVRLAQEGKTAVMDADRRLNERRAELTGKFAKAAMKQDQAGMDEARQEIAKFNEKNPGRRITAPQLWQSVRRREQRIREAENGVYLPSKRRDAMEFGAFAFE